MKISFEVSSFSTFEAMCQLGRDALRSSYITKFTSIIKFQGQSEARMELPQVKFDVIAII